jgi:hypothetical protein
MILSFNPKASTKLELYSLWLWWNYLIDPSVKAMLEMDNDN